MYLSFVKFCKSEMNFTYLLIGKQNVLPESWRQFTSLTRRHNVRKFCIFLTFFFLFHFSIFADDNRKNVEIVHNFLGCAASQYSHCCCCSCCSQINFYNRSFDIKIMFKSAATPFFYIFGTINDRALKFGFQKLRLLYIFQPLMVCCTFQKYCHTLFL